MISSPPEFDRFTWASAAVVLFFWMGWLSLSEWKYLSKGHWTDSMVVDFRTARESHLFGRRSWQSPTGSGEHTAHYATVRYRDQNTQATVDFEIPVGRAVYWGDRFPIQYIPGDSRSARTNRNVFALILFAMSFAWMSWELIRLILEARSPIVRSRHRPRA